MLHQLLTQYLLPLLIYGFVTGLANFALSRKSQVELWAEAHPKAAGLMKLLRAVGFDPFQVISAISLWSTSKLPDAQRSEFLKATDPKPASKPPSNPMGPMGGMLALCALLSLSGCAGWRPIVKDIDTAAVILCDVFFSQQPKNASLSPADVEKAFCSTAKQIEPFLASAKMAAERGGEVRLQRVEK